MHLIRSFYGFPISSKSEARDGHTTGLSSVSRPRQHSIGFMGGLLKDWLSMVLRLRQHNIGYTADGFYRSDDPTNSVKALKEGG